MAEYIGLIFVDPAVVEKINAKHHLTVAEVRAALQWPAVVQGFWADRPEHGRRYVVRGTGYSGQPILAWLHAVDVTDGTWALRSARVGT